MNKKYKPKKPIVYDTDRSLLHSASETLLFAKGKDTIIGQPQCNTKQVQTGTKRVQVGTNVTKDIFGLYDMYYSYTNGGGLYRVWIRPNTDNVKCVFRQLLNRPNATEQRTVTECPKYKATAIKQFQTRANSDAVYMIWDIYFGDKIVYTLNGYKSLTGGTYQKMKYVSYSEPVYEDQPVYRTEVDRGLIMYLRRKGA